MLQSSRQKKSNPVAFEPLKAAAKQLIRRAGIQLPRRVVVTVLDEYEALYFPIPKVATSSMLRVCATLLHVNIWKDKVVDSDGNPYLTVERKELFKHIKSKELAKYKDYFKFCFVRNPWDRLVSCYSDKIKKDNSFNDRHFVNGVFRKFLEYNDNLFKDDKFKAGMSFEEFVNCIIDIPDADADGHFISQHMFITDVNGKQLVDFIGKLESLDNDFAYVREKLGIHDITFPHRLKSNRESYKVYYTKQLRDMVGQRYSKDIEMFGYEF